MAKKMVDSWMADLSPGLQPIAEALRRLILEADPNLSEAIKWGNPVYEKRGKVCYLGAMSDRYMTLGFFNGASLTDPQGLIEGTGAKMRHVKVRKLEEVRPEVLTSMVEEAISLDEA